MTNITLCLNNKFSPNNELLSYAGCCFCISYPKDLNPTCKNTRLSLKSGDIKMLTKVMNTDSQENVATICPHFESESLASSLKTNFLNLRLLKCELLYYSDQDFSVCLSSSSFSNVSPMTMSPLLLKTRQKTKTVTGAEKKYMLWI